MIIKHGTITGNIYKWFNSLQNDKILDRSKRKGFEDNNLNVNQKLKFALGMAENIVGKEENAGYQHFLLFIQCFQKATSLGLLKVGIECGQVQQN